MNAQLCKHLRRIAREAQPDASRSYVSIKRKTLKPTTEMFGGLVVTTPEPNVSVLNAPGSRRAVERALKREARKQPTVAVKRWRLKEQPA